MNIYLTRHGQTEWNIQKKFQGWKNSNLTEIGKKQAELLSKRLKKIKIDKIYTSPLKRAYETSEIIKNNRKMPIIEKEGLKEIYLGEFEGKNYEKIKESNKLPKQLYNFWYEPENYKPDKGETFQELKKRVENTLYQIINENNESSDILIVTHGVTLKMIFLILLNENIKNIWKTTYTENTSLSLFEYNNEKFKLKIHGDIKHLKENYNG
ncbi:MAG: hypothetical protein PWP28_1931 [Oceanotoga sp.]|uniref:histidine phosphatase family protein n=1 Tax=Oceanotoga sp. TaxID=2108366 RepID=UPI002652820B|nr:histidine phosphatase family protein [Oceanotoga sp.]MDN5343056.1 hypothetical protein [Oceanotoga sp.]